MERKLFLVRHLKTEYNKDGKIMGGLVNMEVTSDIKGQSKLAANIKTICERFEIRRDEVDIISSPLLRCVQTAEIIRDAIDPGLEIKIDNNLQETNMGDFTDKKASELRQEYGDLIDIWMQYPEDFTFPNGESYKNVRSRVEAVLKSVTSSGDGKRAIFLCSHVDIIKMLICGVQGVSFNTRRNFKIPNASISVVTLNKDNRFEIEGLNIYP